MPDISAMSPAGRRDLIDRLKKIEGQARGIQKMIEEGRDCNLIINQVAAMRAASSSMNGRLLELYARYCVEYPDEFGSTEDAINELVNTVLRVGR